MLETLLSLGADVRRHGGPALIASIRMPSEHSARVVEWLLKNGVDANYEDPEEVTDYDEPATPLNVAVMNRGFEIVELLFRAGAVVQGSKLDSPKGVYRALEIPAPGYNVSNGAFHWKPHAKLKSAVQFWWIGVYMLAPLCGRFWRVECM